MLSVVATVSAQIQNFSSETLLPAYADIRGQLCADMYKYSYTFMMINGGHLELATSFIPISVYIYQ